MVEFLLIFLKKEGYSADGVTSFDDAESRIDQHTYDLVITDLRIRDRSGIELLKKAKDRMPTAEVIMITAYASTENAIEAMKFGAYDYVTKPFNVEEFRVLVRKALEKKSLREENLQLHEKLTLRDELGDLVGKSQAMADILEMINRVKDTRSNILITGESGTGKEVIARALHNRSSRRARPFVAVNCGALPENLIESELFGYKRGAFTGATGDHQGLVETANGGTLFLDEIGELPQPMQVKLLRVLQERTIRRVGDTQDRTVDVRVVAATNRNLEEEVAAGRFREDLFFRINVIAIHIPPLRERREDITILANHFLRKFNRDMNKQLEGFTEACMSRLAGYEFPGNVRELENTVERAVALSPGPRIDTDALSDKIRGAAAQAAGLPELTAEGFELEAFLERIEKQYLLRALELAGGTKNKAAELLGMSFRSFRYKLEKHEIK
jgi:two-component system response regulator PilR (NtrC family)